MSCFDDKFANMICKLKDTAKRGSLSDFNEIEKEIRTRNDNIFIGHYRHCLNLAIYNDNYDIAESLISRGYEPAWTAGQTERCIDGTCADLYTKRMRLLIIKRYAPSKYKRMTASSSTSSTSTSSTSTSS